MKLKEICNRIKNRIADEQGQSMVETALVLPLLLLVLCGIIDFGWIYSNQYKVEYAAYNGARFASMNASNYTTDELFELAIRVRVAQNLKDGDKDHVEVELDWDSREATITIDYPVKTLTFVASTIFGRTYTVRTTDVATY